jgi:hypothetical protein
MNRYGSLHNLLGGNAAQPHAAPRVGEGATIILWTDRIAATIIEVRTPGLIVIQADNAVRTDKNGMSETQDYRYEPNASGATYVVRKRKNGQWKVSESKTYSATGHLGGSTVRIGERNHYHDYSF